MPVTPDDMLRKLEAATAEAKATVRELHDGRALALDVQRKEKQRITTLIVEEVGKQVGLLGDEARADMHKAVSDVIDGLAESWRERLGLSN